MILKPCFYVKFYIQLIFSLLLPDSFLVKLLLKGKVMKRYKLTKFLLKTALTYVLCTNAAFAFKVGLLLSDSEQRFLLSGRN